MSLTKHDIIEHLQQEILPLQGYKPPARGKDVQLGLGPLEAAFPNGRFPTGAMHEFISADMEQSAATAGFTAAIAGKLMHKDGICLWIGRKMEIFPRALAQFGIGADRIIFITPDTEQKVAWAMEEALKCEGLAAVVGHLRDIDLNTSRRLQLAVERSRVTGFILRRQPRQLQAIAAVARWRITSLPGGLEDDLPGVGYPRWRVELMKVRNGRPGKWPVEWSAGRFHILPAALPLPMEAGIQKRKAI